MALRKVNLIPDDVVQRRRNRRRLIFWGGVLALSQLAIWGNCGWQLRATRAKAPSAAGTDLLRDQLQAEIKTIETLQERIGRFSSFSVVAHRPPDEILSMIADTLPPETWLSDLTIERAPSIPDGSLLRLGGLSTSNGEVSDFFNRLAADVRLRDVVLRFAKERQHGEGAPGSAGGAQTIEFRIDGVFLDA